MYWKQVENYWALLKHPKFAWDYCFNTMYKLLKIRLGGSKKQTGRIGKRKILGTLEAEDALYQALSGDEPVFIGRNGGTESNYIRTNEMLKMGIISKFSPTVMKDGKDHSGIFPAEEQFSIRFSEFYAKAINKADITVYWGHILTEDYLLGKYVPDAQLIPSRVLEPFYATNPWTKALRGKKVLLVHPFEDEIQAQYKRREELFTNQDILPEFELYTIKAVQSLADEESPFVDWFEAYHYMCSQIEKVDFDVAILGCGAYAMPLGSFIKCMGKKAIVLGGMTQLLFGIKGARWDRSRPDIVKLYNDSWIRVKERPKGTERTEGNAYW